VVAWVLQRRALGLLVVATTLAAEGEAQGDGAQQGGT
jgi:hypothetical protein